MSAKRNGVTEIIYRERGEMKIWLTKSVGLISTGMLAITWLYFFFVVWISNHPAIDNYIHARLHLDAAKIMEVASLIGLILGIYASISIRRLWLIPAVLNGISFIIVLLSPKAV